MQRLKLHILEGEVTRRLEAERRESKRAEARLQNGLHDLEDARFYSINQMMKEQRRIQKDLIRIKNGYSKKKIGSSFGRLCPDYKMPAKETPGCDNKALSTKPVAKDGSFILASERIRAQNSSPVKPGRIEMLASVSRALQIQINDFLSQLSDEGEGKANEQAGAEEDRALMSPNAGQQRTLAPIDVANLSGLTLSTAKSSGKPAHPVIASASRNKAAEVTDNCKKSCNAIGNQSNPKQVKARPSTSNLQRDSSSDPCEFYAPDGLPRTVHTMPNFHEAFAEARKARYIRHRSKPERELSISDVFRKRGSSTQSGPTEKVQTVQSNSSAGKRQDEKEIPETQ
ncbi:coiled-coil domain-containing protein 190 [Narcine bancroftii]|uniref:coiled-coil domain-containing protein 190 n=1 Tax=Narcine bancroftii TaxID=1343680 RepID=UPI003831AB99